jgi:tRNA-dihydrouridine synthase
MSEIIPILGNATVSEVIEAVKHIPILKNEDISFLQENSRHLATVIEKTHIWRTDTQKLSIINDVQFPTAHAKLHQSMLEQKVQFDQAMYLAKDFEFKKLEAEEKQLDLSELGDSARDKIKKKKLEIELQFINYELKQMQISMHYRMEEIKGWQKIQNELLDDLRASGMSEEEIWSKNAGELKFMFYYALNNLQSLPTTTDSAERSNLISIALFSYKNAQRAGMLEEFKKGCNSIQLDSLNWLEKQLG